MTTDKTQELDNLCPICNGSMWQMNADYEEVPCWHDIHDSDIKQAVLDWHNKQIEEVLDRLEQSAVKYGGNNVMNVGTPNIAVPLSAIEAKRNKLEAEL